MLCDYTKGEVNWQLDQVNSAVFFKGTAGMQV
jgi:hypothetical protein